jgi:hypothetical protein
LPNHSKKLVAALVIVLILLTSTIGILINQNAALGKANDELLKANDELSSKLKTIPAEFEALKKNYTELLGYFGTSDPKIATRLGATLIDPVNNPDDNYVWVTGEIENTENKIVYDVRLKFTLFTNNGVDTVEDLIGTMQPHQIVERRFRVDTSVGKITNWAVEPVSTFLPTNYSQLEEYQPNKEK